MPTDQLKRDVLMLAHRLKLPRWRYIPISEYPLLKISRISGALTNAVRASLFLQHYWKQTNSWQRYTAFLLLHSTLTQPSININLSLIHQQTHSISLLFRENRVHTLLCQYYMLHSSFYEYMGPTHLRSLTDLRNWLS